MFGEMIKKYCPTCKKDVTINVSVGYWVDGKTYYTDYSCYTCHTDLCEEDREALKLAKENGKEIGIIMT